MFRDQNGKIRTWVKVASVVAIVGVLVFCCLSSTIGSFLLGKRAVAVETKAPLAATSRPTATPTPTPTPVLEPETAETEPEACVLGHREGSFELQPNQAANGGHVFVNGEEFLFVDDRVVVVTNHSQNAVLIDSTDGAGIERIAPECPDPVQKRFTQGCDPDGCGQVLWVNITNSGVITTVVTADP